MGDNGNNMENTQIVRAEELTLSTMDLQQQRMAERLYSQLGLDPVVETVLKEYKGNLKGVDRATDRVFGPYDIKGRAESVAKVASLMTYSALHQQYTKELEGMQGQIDEVEGQRDKERANYDTLVMKVADIVGGDYNELKSNYEEVVQSLSNVEHLQAQTLVLNREKAELATRYETQLAEAQKDKADTVSRYEALIQESQKEKADITARYEAQLAESQKEKADTVARYEAQIVSLSDEHKLAAEDLRGQVAERGSQIKVLDGEKAALIFERDELSVQLEELKKARADLESRLAGLTADHDNLKQAACGLDADVDYKEIRTRMSGEMHSFMMEDSKVPHAVMDGVGKFIDFKKYLGHAAETGARDAVQQAVGKLSALK